MLADRLVPVCVLAALAGLGACNSQDEAMASRLNETTSKLGECQKTTDLLKEEMGKLRRQLAEAMADPARVRLNDGDVIELVAKIRKERAAASGGSSGAEAPKEKELTLGKGDLNPSAASRIVIQGAGALQVCYEKALKKNSSLQYRQGLPLTLGLTIKPTGQVQAVDVNPPVDVEMSQCMKGAASRWKFPPFGGQSVTVEQRLTLSPKT